MRPHPNEEAILSPSGSMIVNCSLWVFSSDTSSIDRKKASAARPQGMKLCPDLLHVHAMVKFETLDRDGQVPAVARRVCKKLFTIHRSTEDRPPAEVRLDCGRMAASTCPAVG
jgi:hypothetical protein